MTKIRSKQIDLNDSSHNPSLDWDSEFGPRLINSFPGHALKWAHGLNSQQIPTYASNALALAGGLIIGDFYKSIVDGDGILKIVV